MNVANLQIEGLLMAVAAINNALAHKGILLVDDLDLALRQVEASLTGDERLYVLRHTRGTWLAQANVPANEAAASLGLTVDEYERTYLHNDPDFRKSATDAY